MGVLQQTPRMKKGAARVHPDTGREPRAQFNTLEESQSKGTGAGRSRIEQRGIGLVWKTEATDAVAQKRLDCLGQTIGPSGLRSTHTDLVSD